MNDENIFSKTMTMIAGMGAAALAVIGAITLSIVVLAKAVGPEAGNVAVGDSKSESATPAKGSSHAPSLSDGKAKPVTPGETSADSNSKTESKPSREAVTHAPNGSTRI